MDPMTFLARLAAQVPFPRQHMLTYHGILAPAASARDRVVPPPDEATEKRCRSANHDTRTDAPQTNLRSVHQGTRRRYTPWAELMRRVFLFDLLTCPLCAGKRRVLAMVRDPASIRQILTHLGFDTQPPKRGPPRFVQGSLQFD